VTRRRVRCKTEITRQALASVLGISIEVSAQVGSWTGLMPSGLFRERRQRASRAFGTAEARGPSQRAVPHSYWYGVKTAQT
jgi:hypothetical protein